MGKYSLYRIFVTVKKIKVSSYIAQVSFYIAQYPSSGLFKALLHFTSLADPFNQTLYQLLWEASSRMLLLMREGCSYTYPPLSIAR